MRLIPSLPGPRLVPSSQPFPTKTIGPAPQLGVARAASPERKAAAPQPVVSPAQALAHDARNALTSLRLIAGLLDAPGVLPGRHMHFAVELKAIERSINSLVERLVALRGASPRPLPEPVQSVGAGEAVQGCLPMLELSAGPRTVVHASAEKGLPGLRLSDENLGRVLNNLVKNASEAMPEGGTVTITTRRALSLTSPAVLIHVTDDGPGIPELALDQIFQPGFSSKVEGSQSRGLGLAIVRDLVEAAGGKVKAASRRGRGTTFELRIPCREKGR